MSFEKLMVDVARRDLASLSFAVVAWLDPRIDPESDLGQVFAGNHTQLVALREWFVPLLAALGEQLTGSPPPPLVRQVRRSVLGLYSLWDTLRRRLQQREGPEPDLFACADDVAYCCHEPAIDGARVRFAGQSNHAPRRRPPPLPFLGYDADPRMFPSGLLPEAFEKVIGRQTLGPLRKTWPLTMVHLPVSYAWGPWWLVLLGHEAGHAIQHDLGLAAPFAAALRKAAEGAKRPPDECAAWSRWGEEIFADACSVIMMGRSAIRALFEVVYDDSPDAMQRRYVNYPPAAIRLVMMTRLADELALPDELAVPVELDPIVNGHPHTQTDAATLDAILPVLTGQLPNEASSCTLAELCGFGLRSQWSATRAVVQESFAEYATREILDAQAVEKLAAKTLERVRANAPAGLRGPQGDLGLTKQGAAELAGALLKADWSDA